MDIQQVKKLLQRYQAGNCTDAERELIEGWYDQLIETGEGEGVWEGEREGEPEAEWKWRWDEEEREMMQHLLEERILQHITDRPGKPRSPVFHLLYGRWWAAAVVILLLGTLGYVGFFYKSVHKYPMAKVLPSDIMAPQFNRATIKLANGQTVFLDSAANGALAVQGNITLIKLPGGGVAYQNRAGAVSGQMKYNTILNPRGSKVVHVVLSDGTKVWLNAGSDLTYPVAFLGDKREVSIRGEGYFEVTHNAAKPFVVKNGSVNIQVLGTHFNVDAFEDEGQGIAITLLEGAVRVSKGSETGLLKPGQQARVGKDVKVVNGVDLEGVMAWKNGYFHFDHSSLQIVLKQIARWYDVEVIYKGENQPREFVGELQMDLSLSEVLKILEKNKVKFRLEPGTSSGVGNKLIVLPD